MVSMFIVRILSSILILLVCLFRKGFVSPSPLFHFCYCAFLLPCLSPSCCRFQIVLLFVFACLAHLFYCCVQCSCPLSPRPFTFCLLFFVFFAHLSVLSVMVGRAYGPIKKIASRVRDQNKKLGHRHATVGLWRGWPAMTLCYRRAPSASQRGMLDLFGFKISAPHS